MAGWRQGSEILTAIFLALVVTSRAVFADDTPDPSSSSTQETDSQSLRRIYWDDGLRFRIGRKPPVPEDGLTESVGEERFWITGKVNVGLQVDSDNYVTSDGLEHVESGWEVRRFKLGVAGEIHALGSPLYAMNFELAGTKPQWADTYLLWQGLPWIGSLKVGNFDPPFSLEALISSRDVTFMEQASPVAAFAPGRRIGVAIGTPVWDESVTWSVGLFTAVQTQDVGDTTRDAGRIAGRVTWLVSRDAAARRWVHLGLSVTAVASQDSLEYRSRPESHLAPYLVDTGTLRAGEAELVDLEAAWVEGPFSLQSEVLHSFVDQPGASPLNFGGAYVNASWFLTDECRPYDATRGIFGPVTPRQAFSLRGPGWGAFEFGTRLSYLDLTSQSVHGGVIHGVTGDLTWYLNRHWKTKFEYGFEAIRSGASNGNLQFFQLRFQVDY
ncbi:MAG TPA: porin [Myxococcota bacterium]|nr:porin [Myxococcota bacterium]